MAKIYSGRDVGKYVEPILETSKSRLWVVSPYISPEYAHMLAQKAREGAMVFIVTTENKHTRKALNVFRRTCQRVRVKFKLHIFLVALASLTLLPLLLRFSIDPLMADLYVITSALALAFFMVIREASWQWFAGLAAISAIAAIALVMVDNTIGVHVLARNLAYALVVGAYSVGAVFLAYDLSVKRIKGAPKLNGGLHVVVLPSSRIAHTKMIISDNVAVTGSANLTKRGLWRNMETITIHEGAELGELIRQFNSIWEDARRNMIDYIGCGRVNPLYSWFQM